MRARPDRVAAGELGSEDRTVAWQERLLGQLNIQRQRRALWDDLRDTERVALVEIMAGSPTIGIEHERLVWLERLGLVFNPAEPTCIVAVHGQGYRFVQPEG